MTRSGLSLAVVAALVVLTVPAHAQAPIKAQIPASIAPAWSKGMQPISRDSYYHAIECGKAGRACVFYDADLCKNPDFALALYSPYKQVAYEVWQAVSQKRPAPTPDYNAAKQTKVVIGITPVSGSKNALKSLILKRGGNAVEPVSRTIDGRTGNFIFDFAAVAPTAAVTLELAGSTAKQTCLLDRTTLSRLR